MTNETMNLVQTLVSSLAVVGAVLNGYLVLAFYALRKEIGQRLAETENQIIARINGTYVRKSECHLCSQHIHESLSELRVLKQGR